MKICMYEGYLRNRKQLQKDLSLPDCTDRRQAESAIILAAYQKWGYDIGNHLYGSFAFVIQDEDKDELFGIRDHFGLEPFYYYLTDQGKLLYGTDLAPIKDSSDYKKSIDHETLMLYMIFGYPVGDHTLYKGIMKLMPGCYFLFGKGKLQIHTWFDLDFCPDHSVSEEEWVGRINRTLSDILEEDRSCFDFSKGASFLSGGVDSSFLLASSGLGQAYGIGYENSNNSESGLARATAQNLGVSFKEITITPDEYFDAIPDLLKQTKLPTADASTPAFFLACRQASQGSGFCLSGEGADEFFAGYHIYRRAEELGRKDGPGYYGCSGIMTQSYANQLLLHPLPYKMPAPCQGRPDADYEPLSRMLMADISLWFEGDILFGAGQSAKASKLPVLMPYADRRMFDLAAQIPSSLKRTAEGDKYIFRKAASGKLPHETAFRNKVGFFVPARDWARQDPYRCKIEKIIFSALSASYYDQEVLRKTWSSFLKGNNTVWSIIYAVYIFLLWHETCY